MCRTWCAALVGLILMVTAFPASAETLKQVLAAPTGERVHDFAKVLPRADRARLRDRLQKMAKGGSAQGTIVVVQQVDGESIESFARQFANKKRFGSTTNKKFVIVVAIAQRRWRLETNRALRASISDAEAKTLMQKHGVPEFRQKRYGQGLEAALKAIDIASRKPAPARTAAISYPSSPRAFSAANPPTVDPVPMVGPLVIAIVGVMVVGLFVVLVMAGLQTAAAGGFDQSSLQSRVGADPHQHFSHFNDAAGSDHTSSFAASPDPGSYNSSGCDSGSSGDGGGGASGSW